MDKITEMLVTKLSIAARAATLAYHGPNNSGVFESAMDKLGKAQAAYFHHENNVKAAQSWSDKNL